MKQITIKIPDESRELVTELVEKLGGVITEKETTKFSIKKKATSKKQIDHTFLFGKWKNFDIDQAKLEQNYGEKAKGYC